MKATYGVNFDRMVALKTKFDPGNLFRLNANVAPAGRTLGQENWRLHLRGGAGKSQATAARIGLSGTSTSSMA